MSGPLELYGALLREDMGVLTAAVREVEIWCNHKDDYGYLQVVAELA